jgi:hypothetical protein
VSVNGDNISTTATVTQSAANQKIQNPAMGQAQMKVISLTKAITGTVASDLSKLIPLQASMDMHMDMNSEMTMGDKTQAIPMKMAMNMTIESK